MPYLDLKTVAADIDSTSFSEPPRKVAIRYIKSDGSVKDILASKRVKQHVDVPKKSGEQEGSRRVAPHMKRKALIPIIDHTDHGQAKNLFLYSILAYNKDGDLTKLYPVKA